MGDVEDVYREVEMDISIGSFREAVDERVKQMGGVADREEAAMLLAHEFRTDSGSSRVGPEPEIKKIRERESQQSVLGRSSGEVASTSEASDDEPTSSSAESPTEGDATESPTDDEKPAVNARDDTAAESGGQTLPDGVKEKFDDPSSYDERYPPDWDARRRHVYQRDDYRCANCATQSGPYADGNGVPLHAHHVVPLSRGGTNRVENLITVCESCHNDIHTHDITGGSQQSTTAKTSSATSEQTQSGSTASTSSESQGMSDESFLGGLLQFIVLVPLYVFSLQAIFDVFAGGSMLWAVLGTVGCLLYIAVAAGYPTRTFGCHAIWGVLVIAFGGPVLGSVVILGAPFVLGVSIRGLLEKRAESN